MTLIFNDDKRSMSKAAEPLIVGGGVIRKSENSIWKILKEDGKKVTLELTPTEGKDKDIPETIKITLLDDHSFTLDEAPSFKNFPGIVTFRRN